MSVSRKPNLFRIYAIGPLLSVLLHVFLLLLLAIFIANMPEGGQKLGILAEIDADSGELTDSDAAISSSAADSNVFSETTLLHTPIVAESQLSDSATLAAIFQNTQQNNQQNTAVNPTPEINAQFSPGGGYENRSQAGRDKALSSGATTIGSENAVERGLEWLAAHQSSDGGWDFRLPCDCEDSGTHASRIAATAIATLAFLGAGNTHLEGKYKRVVDRALYFLVRKGITSQQTGLRLYEGVSSSEMYTHGIATLSLCEAHGMTRKESERLTAAVSESLRFTQYAQDTRTGGWRYLPGQSPGDLCVTAWQAMSLKSGQLSEIPISRGSIYGIERFLNTVQEKNGVRYSYLPPETNRIGKGLFSDETCTATGILLRMYLGKKDAKLDSGIELLEKWGLLEKDNRHSLYYLYYATMALHHSNGESWTRTFPKVRDFLVLEQAKNGHEIGSWHIPDPDYSDKGGRLLNTALAILILELPYRYLPLYEKKP